MSRQVSVGEEKGTDKASPSTRAAVVSRLAKELRAYQSALDAFDEAIGERLGLNRTDLRCLDLITQHEAMSPGALADKSGLTTGAVTFVLDRLERAGFLKRRRDDFDRRRVVLEAEPVRHEEAYRLHEPLIMEMRRAAQHFDLDELTVIERFLVMARVIYERQAKALRSTEEIKQG